MVKIGDICPLFFNPIKDRFARDIDYIQCFYVTDTILIQTFANDGDSVSALLHNLVSGDSSNISLSTYNVNGSVKMYYATLTGLDDSVYSVSINGNESEPFSVCSSEGILDETCLIRYSHKDNNSAFDNVFWIGDIQQIFEFRVEGGFKPSGVSSKIENEQFRNQFQEIEELYAIPYKTLRLTCGDARGIPYWFGEFINRILCMSMFEVNGDGFVRSENSEPEMSVVSEDGQTFYISVTLEPRINNVAGIGGRPESPSGTSLVGFFINNPKDGELLQYKGSESAFVNTDRVEV